MYDGDSFFTLDPAARTGLLTLSAVLAAFAIWGAWRIAGPPSRRVALAVAAWWAFLWLSPQAYYQFYRAVIPDLPRQVVIGRPPGPSGLLRRLAFVEERSLSRHGQGLLGWAMIGAALASRRGAGRDGREVRPGRR